MWVEKLELENIKCFSSQTVKFTTDKDTPHLWITFIGENGGGKSSALQALALLLAGPEGAQNLLPRPLAWLRDENKKGMISTRIRQGAKDSGQFGEEKITRSFGYKFHITGGKPLEINDRLYFEPTIVENGERHLSWLRKNAFSSNGAGWFAAGYGAFRRLTRSNQIIIPSLEPSTRFANFITQFNEDEPLSAFERWMVYLDYRISKANDGDAKRKKELGIAAINQLLPAGVRFSEVSEEGRIYFNSNGTQIPTLALSDGYRSVLALAGDLVWRLLGAFPESEDPLKEEGVVLIDELDIHLHPIWQRDIAGWLRNQFQNLQFIVATHSPLIAAGAGEDALTYRFRIEEGKARVDRVSDIASMNVDRILQSEAFGLVSPFSPATQEKIDRYDALARKNSRRSPAEDAEYENLSDFMKEARPIGGPPVPGSLEDRIEKYLEKTLP